MPIDAGADFIVSSHARAQMERRGITHDVVQRILSSPEQRLPVREGRVVFHSRIGMGRPSKMYLLRVFVDIDREPRRIVTVYRTTKLEKYWRNEA
jgi:hypothetical protein